MPSYCTQVLPLLTEPVTTKCTAMGENHRFVYAAASMQGYLPSMEDTFTTILDLDVSSETSFFGVYDGHGGPAIAKHCSKRLHREVVRHMAFDSDLSWAIQGAFSRVDNEIIEASCGSDKFKTLRMIFNSFLPFRENDGVPRQAEGGSTACVAVIRHNIIVVGNVGDSRCIVSKSGQANTLSTDHTPELPSEAERIRDADCEITLHAYQGNIPRIDHGIAISRSIGDVAYKGNKKLSSVCQSVISEPDICYEKVTGETEFLIIASHGIWDCFTNQGVIDYVSRDLHDLERWPPTPAALTEICKSLLDHCVTLPQAKDNMTVVLVHFKQPAATIGPNTRRDTTGRFGPVRHLRQGLARSKSV